jgi:hypothetical protein
MISLCVCRWAACLFRPLLSACAMVPIGHRPISPIASISSISFEPADSRRGGILLPPCAILKRFLLPQRLPKYRDVISAHAQTDRTSSRIKTPAYAVPISVGGRVIAASSSIESTRATVSSSEMNSARCHHIPQYTSCTSRDCPGGEIRKRMKEAARLETRLTRQPVHSSAASWSTGSM